MKGNTNKIQIEEYLTKNLTICWFVMHTIKYVLQDDTASVFYLQN